MQYAKKYAWKAESFEILDLLNEGVIGFIKGLDKFDFSKEKSFNSYISSCIVNKITDALNKDDKMIRRSYYLSSTVTKLDRILRDCESNQKPIPSDEELCKMLNVTSKVLKRAKSDMTYSYLSLNKKIDNNDSGGDTELGDVLDSGDDRIGSIESNILDKELLAYLKLKLSPYKYYVLYNRVFAQAKATHSEIASTLGVTRAAVQAMDSSILKSLRNFFSRGDWRERCSNLLQKNGVIIESFNVAPVTPAHITCYLFLRDALSVVEKQIYLLVLKQNFDFDENRFAKKLNYCRRIVNVACKSLERRLTRINAEMKEEFESFSKMLIETYQTDIFDVDLKMDLSKYRTYRDCCPFSDEAYKPVKK